MSEGVPEGWVHRSIGSDIEILSGYPFKSEQFSNDPSDTGLIRIRDLVRQKLETFYKGEYEKQYLVTKGDVLIGMDGEFNIVKWSSKNALLNQRICKLETINSSNFYLDYLFHDLQDELLRINETTGSTTVKHLSVKDIRGIEKSFPPLPEQKKIASILTSVDEVIEKTQSQIDKLQDLKKGTMNELLTKGIGHTEFKDSELGRIPKSWEVKHLNEVAKVADCKHHTPTYRDEGYPVVRPRDVKFSGIDFEQCVLVDEDDFNDLNENHKPSVGDTVYSRNATFGIGSYVEYPHDFAIGQDVCIISPRNMNPRFLNLYLNSEIVFSQVLNEMSGSTFKRINLGSIKNFKIATPEYDEQEKLADMIFSTIISIHQKETKRHKYISLKKSLMQDLLTGKVRV